MAPFDRSYTTFYWSASPLISTWPRLRCDVGLEEGEYSENCLCVTVLCTIILVHKGTSSSYRLVDCIGLCSCSVFSSLIFWVPLCLWSSWCYICVKQFLLTSFFLPLVSWAWWDWPLTIILQCCDTVGWVIWLVKSSPKWPIMCRVRR